MQDYLYINITGAEIILEDNQYNLYYNNQLILSTKYRDIALVTGLSSEKCQGLLQKSNIYRLAA